MGTPIRNKVLDGFGNLKPEYCNVRYIYGGTVFHDYEMSVKDAVDTGFHHNLGVVGLEKVEWCGAQISGQWSDVTALYKNMYHERTYYAS